MATVTASRHGRRRDAPASRRVCCGSHVRGSSDGTSLVWTRSVVTVASPAARHRSHDADDSPDEGHRKHNATSRRESQAATSASST
jgi:hypothetical protein